METYVIFLLCLAAFFSGFVDAIVGGGGLIQTPIAILLMPQQAVSSIIGSLKIPAFSGTFMASTQYIKRVKFNYKLLLTMSIIAFTSAYLGSSLLTKLSNDFFKPILLIVLIFLVIYTFFKKDFGQIETKEISIKKQYFYGILIAVLVGFYDGFIGPGTGSIFILGFVSLLGYNFLNASANSKLINLATNIGSISLFLFQGKIIWAIALPMAFCNALGGFIGAKFAISKGNRFIRYFFLFVITLTLLRFSYDIL